MESCSELRGHELREADGGRQVPGLLVSLSGEGHFPYFRVMSRRGMTGSLSYTSLACSSQPHLKPRLTREEGGG